MRRDSRTQSPRASVADQVGRHPCSAWSKSRARAPSVEVYAKLEFANPGGSVKDRPALRMMLDAIEGRSAHHRARPSSTPPAATPASPTALFGAALGYPVELVMPSNVTKARKDIAQAFGTKIIYSDPMEGSDGAIRLVRKMVAEQGPTLLLPRPVRQPRATPTRTTSARGARSSTRSATGSRTS